MKHLLLITLLLSVKISFSQTTLKGKIFGENQKVLPYCKIGIENTFVGTLSNEDGFFTLEIPSEYRNNDIKISFIGYQDLQVKMEDISLYEDLVFSLKPKDYEIEDITVTPKEKFREGKDKEKTSTTTNFSISNQENKNLGSEIGKLFKIKRSVIINKVNFFVDYNDYEEVKLRLNIYTVKDKKPAENILSDELFISFGKTNGDWKSIDLSNYDIVLNQDVIITLEWIYGSEGGKKFGLPIIIPSIGATHYYRFGSQGSWKKFSSMSISMTIEGYYID